LFEPAGTGFQGAVCALPIPDFPTGIMRGRFHPGDGQLYLCGLSAWATSQTQQEGGLYRLRPTGKPALLPVGWHVSPTGIELTFSDPPDADAATDLARYTVKTWRLKRSANYGSPRIDEKTLAVTAANLRSDALTVELTIPSLTPTDIIEIVCRLRDATGADVERVITGTIHVVPATLGGAGASPAGAAAVPSGPR
jgi:hypothetical protein